MNVDQLLLRDDTEISEPLADVTSLIEALAPLLLLSLALTITVIGLYIRSSLKRRKLEKAILDIQKTVHEMNERDKARNMPTSRPQIRSDKETIIARVDDSK